MNNMKKLLALLLAIVMVLGMFPLGAMAEETEPELCTCGLVLNHDGECQSQEPAPQNLEEPELCTCGLEKGHEGECKTAEPEYCDCGLTKGHEGDCKTAEPEYCDCGLTKGHEGECKTAEPEYCDCGLTKGHEGECKTAEPEYCDCGLTKGHEGECKKAEPEKCALCESTEHATNLCTLFCGFCQKVPCECVVCEKCSVKNGHTDQCELKPCEICGKNPCECEIPETTESVEVCEFCGVELTEDAKHAEGCLSLCTCDPKPEEGESHKEECPLYVEEILGSIEYSGITSSGISATVIASGTAFPVGTEMTVADTSVDMGAIDAAVNGAAKFMLRRNTSKSNLEILGVKAVDISFGGEQPSEPVHLAITVPDSEVPSGANQAIIVHFGENGPEKVASQYLTTNVNVHSFSVTVDGFSSYAVVFVNGKYQSRLLRDVLDENPTYSSRYSIAAFPVDLIDYTNPVAFNAALTGTNKFMFTSYGATGVTGTSGINDSTATYANQGILETKLDANGLPKFKYVDDANTGAKFFGTTAVTGKTMYNDIPFEFIFDNETGYYEYKSAANHAQLNDDGTKIELYADTLSTQNSTAAKRTLDLSTASGLSDIINSSATATLFKGTAYDPSPVNGARLDPYVAFSTGENGVDASTVSKIYIKAKVPAAVGPNELQLFFAKADKGFNEDWSYLVDYTPNGDWIEFVVDTTKADKSGSTNNWSGTITSLRVDLFDQNKGNVNPSGQYNIEIAEVTFIQNAENYVTYGGFYPFANIADSYPGNNEQFTLASWQNKMSTNNVSIDRASRAMGNHALSPDALNEKLAYAVVMEFDFYLPVDRTDRDDLIYHFNGDDDLWVFVDDQLVLDIGGGHGAIQGNINFTDGTSYVASAVQVTGYNSTDNNPIAVTKSLDAALTAPGKHTMKAFYMERCGSVSNCQMKFNLPQTPDGDVTISKILELNNADESSNDAEIKETEKFEFTVQVQNILAGGDEIPHVYSGSYVLMDATGTGHNKNTTDGKIPLAHGETAFIAEIAEGSEVTVTERDHAIAGYSNPIVKVNETTAKTAKLITGNDTDIAFAFVNQYTEQTVQYTYIPVNPTNCPEDQKGTVKLTGDDTTKTAADQGVTETVGKRVGTPSGSTAEGSNAVKFVGWYSDAECTQLISENQEYVPARAQGEKLLPGGTVYAKFEFMYGNLTIDKTGIQTVDNDSDEKQSTIYEISGTSSNGTSVYLEVVIVGNSSVTVKDLPVGDYTVNEKTTWSWRYTPDANLKSATIRGNETTTVDFVNNRNKLLWLSGDSYARNWWGGSDDEVIKASGIVTVTRN